MWANHRSLLEPFQGLACTCKREHGKLEGSYKGKLRSRLAQVWPAEMCHRIVSGIMTVLQTSMKASRSYPVEEKRKDGSKYPWGAIFDCSACKRKLHQFDVRHTRKDSPPDLCRFWDICAEIYECPACVKQLSADHPDHTRRPSECRCPNSRVTGVRRKKGPVRDGVIHASGDPSDRNRLADDTSFDRDVVPPILGGASTTREERSSSSTDPAAGRDVYPRGKQNAPAVVSDADDEAEDDEDVELAPASAREARSRASDRRRRLQTADNCGQAGGGASEDWRTFDVSRAMLKLRSSDPSIRKTALQRFHARWWHSTITEMTNSLRAAGAPPYAIADIPAVVHACQVCRAWTKPGPRNVATFRLVEDFNVEAQMDLLFDHSLIEPSLGMLTLLHLIDVCIRWSACTMIQSKSESHITQAISAMWITKFWSNDHFVF